MNLRSGKVLGAPLPCFGTSRLPSLDEAREYVIKGSLEFGDFVSYCNQMIDLCKQTDNQYKKRTYLLAVAESLFKLDKELIQKLYVFVGVVVHKLEEVLWECLVPPPDLLEYIKKLKQL